MRAVVMLMLLLSFSVTGDIYRVYVDREFGFWAVRTDNLSHALNWTNKILDIRTGDRVVWENGDSNGDRVTIISDNRLWNDTDAILGIDDLFGLTFNSSGTFTFHIKEINRTTFNTSNQTRKIKEIERFPYQRMYLKVKGNKVGVGTTPVAQQKAVIERSNRSPDAVPTPAPFKIKMKEKQAPVQTATPTATVMPLESYQEFTLFEVFKRWYNILLRGG